MDARPAGTTCRFCGAAASPPFALCFCCATLIRHLQMPLVPLVAVAEFRSGDVLHRRLRGYKDAPVAEVRAACTARLAAMVGDWLTTGPAPAWLPTANEWDLVVTVPSSCRPEGDPVAAVVGAVAPLAGRHRPLLVRGPAPTGHLRAARQGFVLRPGRGPAPAARPEGGGRGRQRDHRGPRPERGRRPAPPGRRRRGRVGCGATGVRPAHRSSVSTGRARLSLASIYLLATSS